MRVYHKHLHEYATVIRQTATHYLLQYDGSDQIWNAPIYNFDVVEELEDVE